jgi:hypothetical protein
MSQNNYNGKCMWKTGGMVWNWDRQGSNPSIHPPNPFLKFLKYILFFKIPHPLLYIESMGGGGMIYKIDIFPHYYLGEYSYI